MKIKVLTTDLISAYQTADLTKKWIYLEGEHPENRTSAQNRALHLLFTQVSKECVEKGIEMRDIVRDEIPIEVTPENIKWLWKLLQDALLKIKSTKELKKDGQINLVYDTFNKILIERTDGEISLPPFPSLNLQIKEVTKDLIKDYKPAEEVTAF